MQSHAQTCKFSPWKIIEKERERKRERPGTLSYFGDFFNFSTSDLSTKKNTDLRRIVDCVIAELCGKSFLEFFLVFGPFGVFEVWGICGIWEFS